MAVARKQSIDVYIIVSKLVPETARNITTLLSIPEITSISLLWNGVTRLKTLPFVHERTHHTDSSKRLPVAQARNTLLKTFPPQSDLIFWMDEDAYVETCNLEELFEFLQTHQKAGVIGPRLIYPDGTPQESARLFQTPWILALRLVSRIINYQFTRVQKSLFPIPDTTQAYPVDWLLGASHLYTRDLFETIGTYDEFYTRTYDDVEFSQRAFKAGYVNYYVPFALVVHTYSKSSQRLWSREFFRHLKDACYFFISRARIALSSPSSRRSSRT
jgi:GT2 family glycosyltransferase